MIAAVVSHISEILNDTIKRDFNLSRDIVKIQPIEDNVTDGAITVSLLSMERDTSAGIAFTKKNVSDKFSSKGNPPWNMNLYILVSAVFPQKQYEEALQLITHALKVLQENQILFFEQSGTHFTLEPVNLTLQELSNVWSISGGSYHPSVICKVRTITIDSNTITQIDSSINRREVNV